MINFLKNNWHYGAAVMSAIYNAWMTWYAFEKYEPHLKSLSFFFFAGAILSGSLLFFFRSLDDSMEGFKEISSDLKKVRSDLSEVNETLK